MHFDRGSIKSRVIASALTAIVGAFACLVNAFAQNSDSQVSPPALGSSPEKSSATPPKLRSRSISLPDDVILVPQPAQVLTSPSLIGFENQSKAPAAITIEWLDQDRRVGLLSPQDMREQGQMFARIALFVETRNAPKTEVIPLDALSGWLDKHNTSLETVTAGNNLRASELARFYNTAAVQKQPLSSHEHALFEALIEHGILERRARGVQPVQPERILLTAPQPSRVQGCSACTVTQDGREAILAHELGHARFFVDQVYRDFCLWFWSHGLPEPARQAFHRLFVLRGYDENNRDLLANEMQAFLMHTPNPQLFSASLLGVSTEVLAGLKELFVNKIRELRLDLQDTSFALQQRPSTK